MFEIEIRHISHTKALNGEPRRGPHGKGPYLISGNLKMKQALSNNQGPPLREGPFYCLRRREHNFSSTLKIQNNVYFPISFE